ncbi:MAG: alpha/beta fold hydrolase [Actinomycetota bacterium]
MGPPVDADLLARHADFVTEGVRERAFFVDLAGTRCLAILDHPAGRPPSGMGFVVCHAFGDEFVNLRRIERDVARTLARLGHPVLTFHRRGYGDSEGSPDAGVPEHLQEVREAMSYVTAEAGADRVGLIGARFGALVAGLAAREGGVDRLLLVNPSLRGMPLFRELARHVLIAQLADDQGAPGAEGDLLSRLETEEVAEVLGYPLYRSVFEGFGPVDLTTDVGSFNGQALVLQVTRSSRVPPDVQAFASAVESRGGQCTVELLPEPPGTRFGQKPFQNVAESTIRRNIQRPVQEAISERAAEWVSR